MQSLHEGKIAKRVFTRIWDSLSPNEQAIVAADTDCETPIAKWFKATVASEVKAKYESPTYWMNEPSTFQYDPENAPANWPLACAA